jgi:hypothetical protein
MREPEIHPSTANMPIRAITASLGYHWFGYYDKLQFDPSMRYVLGMEVSFEHRSPTAEDEIKVGMVDLQDGDRWIELGTSRAWCWQQGCMLQWRPGSRTEVMWNDRTPRGRHGRESFVCHILDVETGVKRTLPYPFYALSPDGRTAVTPDFRRINDMRPGYGYVGLPDPHAHELAPQESGIFGLDLETGECHLLISLAEVAAMPYPRSDLSSAKHYFNHLLFSPDGRRFEFLHRWRMAGQRGFGTRMLTAALDAPRNVHIVDDYGQTSHFIWRDADHILAWAYHPSHEWAFYLYRDAPGGTPGTMPGAPKVVGRGVMTVNGHCTYLPGNTWILNDTYPDLERKQHLYLYHVESGRRVPLGSFLAPEGYRGEWRCDLHPRFSPDGNWVAIDSTHGGEGRQIYLLDISEIVNS